MKISSISLALVFLLSAAAPANADCNVNYGDVLRVWVEKDARQQALALSEADYSSRLNARIVEYESLKSVVADLSTQLDQLAQNAPEKPSQASDTALVQQWATANERLNRLLSVRYRISDFGSRLEVLSAPATLLTFKQWGGQHIGRSGILESILGLLPKADDPSLNRRYSIGLSVTFNDSGSVSDGGFSRDGYKPDEFATLTVIDALAPYATNPTAYLIAVHAVYETFRGFAAIQEDEACERQKRDQSKVAKQAIQKLAETLPSEQELFSLYSSLLANTRTKFLPLNEQFLRAQSAIEARWRTQVGITTAEIDTIGKMLTVAKLDKLVAAYSRGPAVDEIFDRVALSQFTQSLQSLQIATLDDEVKLQSEVRGVQGIAAAETLIDRRHEAIAQLEVAEKQPPLAPVAESIRTMISRLTRPVPRANSLLNASAAAASPAVTSPPLNRANRTADALGRMAGDQISEATKFRAGNTIQRISSNPTLAAASVNGALSCTIYRTQQGYQCGQPPPGSEFSSEFSGGRGSRYSTILGGANDGGFGVDNRRITKTFAAAKSDIDRRTSDLASKNAAISAVLPQWSEGTREAMARQASAEEVQLADERRQAEEFIAANTSADAGMTAQLLRFSREAGAPALSDLLRSAGAADRSLQSLPIASIVATGPVLPGFSHRQRVFGDLRTTERLILRENRKAELIRFSGDRQQLHSRIVSAAWKFSEQQGSSGAQSILDALLLDAASIRYNQTGALRRLNLTFIDQNGALVRRDRMPNQSLDNSLLARSEAFSTESTRISRMIEAGLTGLDPGAPGSRERREVLVTAQRVERKSTLSFYSGRLLDGEAMLEVAKSLLNLATSLPPGVSWGRDVFEALTGTDLITGDSLDEISRTIAFFGAVTGGIGSRGVHGVEMMSRGMKRAQPFLERFVGTELEALSKSVVQKVISIRADTAKFYDHANERISKILTKAPEGLSILGLNENHIRDIVKRGQPLFDTNAIKPGNRNSGLIFVAKPKVVVRPERSRLPLLAVPVELGENVDMIKTSYWMKHYTVEEVLKDGRYRMVPRQSDLLK